MLEATIFKNNWRTLFSLILRHGCVTVQYWVLLHWTSHWTSHCAGQRISITHVIVMTVYTQSTKRRRHELIPSVDTVMTSDITVMTQGLLLQQVDGFVPFSQITSFTHLLSNLDRLEVSICLVTRHLSVIVSTCWCQVDMALIVSLY